MSPTLARLLDVVQPAPRDALVAAVDHEGGVHLAALAASLDRAAAHPLGVMSMPRDVYTVSTLGVIFQIRLHDDIARLQARVDALTEELAQARAAAGPVSL